MTNTPPLPSKIGCFFSNIKKKIAKCRQGQVHVLRLEGIIQSHNGLKQHLCLENLEQDIERAFSGKRTKAVCLQINSPGGTPVQSELIYRQIRMLADEKNMPVYSFVEDVAASGGYWLACAGEHIYVTPGSIVGSIGVISSGFGFTKAIKKLGIERRIYSQGENKSILDPFSEEKASDITILKNAQKDIHGVFKDMVRERREGKFKKTQEKELFSGTFYSGNKAVEKGLADDIGTLNQVIRKKYGSDIRIIRINKSRSWLKRKLGTIQPNLTHDLLHTTQQQSLWQHVGL